jgi:hypothetical protein
VSIAEGAALTVESLYRTPTIFAPFGFWPRVFFCLVRGVSFRLITHRECHVKQICSMD